MTIKSKHTPGPWVEDGYGVLRGADGIAVCVKGLGIAHVTPGGDYPVERANARLMRASPDLFDALKSVMHLLDGEAWEVARAAIAKAEAQP